MTALVPAHRNFLFLQGPVGPFFELLGRRLLAAGHGAHRILFNGGDRWFWRLPGAVDYRGGVEQWPDFLAAALSAWKVTDILLFGDCRPLHRAAARMAALREIAVHVFEEGYLRPNWVTMEGGGVNGHSALPRDPQWFRDAAQGLPPWDGGTAVPCSFARRACEDVLYNGALMLGGWRYPGYRSHRPWHPMVEYQAGARRFFRKPAMRRAAAQHAAEIIADARPYYLFPLQLDADSQIRFHSPLRGIAPAIEAVVRSFARHAPPEARLVLTEHPLDNGVLDHQADAQRAAAAAGVSARVMYLRGGSPDALVQRCRALVTVNSTIGFLALGFGVPVAALGEAIYDLPGLSFQGPLDDFWRQGRPADAETFDAFRRVIAARSQINGSFYSKPGVRLAAAGAFARLCAAGEPAASAAGLAAVAARASAEFSGETQVLAEPQPSK